jgi:PIN domain nuclease of toxin-antitoxin system
MVIDASAVLAMLLPDERGTSEAKEIATMVFTAEILFAPSH